MLLNSGHKDCKIGSSSVRKKNLKYYNSRRALRCQYFVLEMFQGAKREAVYWGWAMLSNCLEMLLGAVSFMLSKTIFRV